MDQKAAPAKAALPQRRASSGETAGVLEHKCACGGSSLASSGCQECESKRLTLQRYSMSRAEPSSLLWPMNQAPGHHAQGGLEASSGHSFGKLQLFSNGPHRTQTKLEKEKAEPTGEQDAGGSAGQAQAPQVSEAKGEQETSNSHTESVENDSAGEQPDVVDDSEAMQKADAGPTQESAEPATDGQRRSADLIVGDDTEKLEPGQMRKSEFLDELRAAVCDTADAKLAAVGRSTEGCPYIESWIGYYRFRSPQQIERALHKYAPEASGATSAREYIALVAQRVEQAVSTWATTGEVTGVPEEVIASGAIAGAVEGAVSSAAGLVGGAVGGLFTKAREGGAKQVEDPRHIQSQLTSGHSLDGGVKSKMETAFGHNFSSVRVHTGSRAAELSGSLNARAFTVGNDLAFASGEYRPGTLVGDALIAHELAHVVQQSGGSTAVSPKNESVSNALEEDADNAAVRAVVSAWHGAKGMMADIGQHAMPRLRSGLKLQRCPDKPKASEPKKEVKPEVTSTGCDKSALGSISTTGSLIGNASQAGMDVTFTLTPPDTDCKCDQYRWLQVADIIPGKWQGRDDSYVDPYPNDDDKPYFWTDSEEAASPNKFTDPPSLKRSRSTDEGKRILNKFETACLCLRTGKNDRIVGMVNWGYEFDTDQTKDTKIGPTQSSSPTSFWKDTVKKDFPSYTFED